MSGGGPAGMMLGLLLARAGIRVTVLEKHADFLRDFRGDTVHASTVRLMDELGLGEKFRRLPQSRLGDLEAPLPDGSRITLSDFASLPAPYNYIAMIPQWDLLAFLAAEASAEPAFTLLTNTAVTGLIKERGTVTGVRYRTAQGVEGELHAQLTVAADGRHSTVRKELGLTPRSIRCRSTRGGSACPGTPGSRTRSPDSPASSKATRSRSASPARTTTRSPTSP
ncbi:FAD-dependent monooxygenase [Nonomuraea antimicrobica]